MASPDPPQNMRGRSQAPTKKADLESSETKTAAPLDLSFADLEPDENDLGFLLATPFDSVHVFLSASFPP